MKGISVTFLLFLE